MATAAKIRDVIANAMPDVARAMASIAADPNASNYYRREARKVLRQVMRRMAAMPHEPGCACATCAPTLDVVGPTCTGPDDGRPPCLWCGRCRALVRAGELP